MPAIRPWILAARPRTLGAVVAPVGMGIAMACGDGGGHAPSALCALAAGLFVQIGANLCNDVADFAKGADGADRTGPLRATAAGLVSPAAMVRATVLAFVLAALAAVPLVIRGGWPLAAVGALAIASAALYTAGPKPLGYLGLGDLFSFVFFGPVAVAGTCYVQTLAWSWTPVAAGIAPGLMSVAILTVNNLRDREGDARAGKRTLAVRFGATFARAEYTVCIAGAALVACGLVRFLGAPPASGLAALVLVPAIPALRAVWGRASGRALNPWLGYTALLSLFHAALFSAGWLL